MAALPAISERQARKVAKKAAVFAFLDAKVGTEKLLAGIEEVQGLPLLCHVKPARIPRRVWMYWHDGWEDAPPVAKLCLRSWQQRNPGYEVMALDCRSVSQFLPEPPQHKDGGPLKDVANRVRLGLLETHGGIWADATLFCTRPVDGWLTMLMPPARAFAFATPAPERIVATWFLAALPNSPLFQAWAGLLSAYFDALESEGQRIHGYFAMAYILEYALTRRPDLRALWDRVPKIPPTETGRVAHIALFDSLGKKLTDKHRAAIADALRTSSLQKLTWKHAVAVGTPAALDMLEILEENLAEG